MIRIAAEIGPMTETPPVLLIHGFSGNAEAWGSSLLGELAQRRRVLVVELPGHGGNSDPRALLDLASDLASDLADTADPARPAAVPEGRDPRDGERPALRRVVDALAGALEARKLAAADWVGYSMGGRIALAAAALRPEWVRRLVLEGASPGIEDEQERARRRTEDDALAERIETLGMEWFVDEWMSRPLFETQSRLPAEVRRAARELRLRNGAAGIAGALRGLGTGAQPSFWEELPGIRIPTLLLTGELDHKFGGIGARMASALPDAVHRSVSGVGHAVHLEAPEAWLRAVLGFLDRA